MSNLTSDTKSVPDLACAGPVLPACTSQKVHTHSAISEAMYVMFQARPGREYITTRN